MHTALLFVLGAPHSASASLSVLERLARELLRRIAPRMLVVDEVHHLLAGNYREQRASRNLPKFPANDLRFRSVLVGTRCTIGPDHRRPDDQSLHPVRHPSLARER